ncbi:MAG: class I SAM-dependent methyltransferase [Actinomycetota bacterium]|nr:class I SAM-dependent methyltransferase [Actinomycetota bacterium]
MTERTIETPPNPDSPAASPALLGAAPGVRGASVGEGADDAYYHSSRPDLRALIPADARRALDVGCGAGALGAALKEERGMEVHGIELFPDAAAVAAERLDAVITADLETLDALPVPRDYFDAMTFGDVLEHVHDPHRLLRVLRPYLAPGGLIACSIPNVKHWSVVFSLLVKDRWTYEDKGLLDRTHVHFFTLEEIDHMLQDTGFAPVSVQAIASPLPPALMPLAELAARFGAELDETVARLGAYQYVVVARRADDRSPQR